MSFYFEGDYRKKANISYRGASKTSDKASLIKQTQEERQKREDQRNAIESARVIQAFARSYLARKLAKHELRQQVDLDIAQLVRDLPTVELQLHSISVLVEKLGRIYSAEHDQSRLISVCQFVLSKRALFDRIANQNEEIRGVLASMCLIQLNAELTNADFGTAEMANLSKTNLNTLFRGIEVCLDVETSTFDRLFDAISLRLDASQIGFFSTLFKLVCDTVSRSDMLKDLVGSGLGCQSEQQARYTELCRLPAFGRIDATLKLLARPLRRDGHLQFYRRFVEQIFAFDTASRSSWNATITHILTPFLCAMSSKPDSVEFKSIFSAVVTTNCKLSPWLACVLLTLGELETSVASSKQAVCDYLVTLHKLVASLTSAMDENDSISASRRAQLSNQPNESASANEPSIEAEIRTIKQRLNIERISESDSDDESPSYPTTSVAAHSVYLSYVDEARATLYALLNRYDYVRSLDAVLRRYAYDSTLVAPLSILLHELLYAHALRPLEHRFVYYFAFNSEFLRASWSLVLDSVRATCQSASTTASAQVFVVAPSRGEQVRRCAPVIGTFATLFAHALISMHDEQFVEAVRRNATASADQPMELDTCSSNSTCSSVMPFLASELIGMCKLLRNIAVGLIELRLPFSNRLSQPLAAQSETDVAICTYLFEKTTSLLRQLYDRDVRRSFSALSSLETTTGCSNPLSRLLVTLENDPCTFLGGAAQQDSTTKVGLADDEPVTDCVERESMQAMNSVYAAYASSSFWISSRIRVNVEKMAQTFFDEKEPVDGSDLANVTTLSPFRQVGWKLARRRAAHGDTKLPAGNSATGGSLARYSAQELRHVTLLVELPYTVPFMHRVAIFQRILTLDKVHNRNTDMAAFEAPGRDGPLVIDISVRRTELYEDAFHALAPGRVRNLKRRMRIQLRNFANLDEAGIDGGGILREFLTELLKQGFDPSRGLFIATNEDRLLYPNAHAETIYGADSLMHYYFLGRMLGKALYEGVLVELPLAAFFVAKLLSSSALSIDYLESLDAELYRNLLFVKNFEGNVESLALDFTVTQANYGEVRSIELKSGGRNVPVTNANRNEYVNLVADFRLNREIRSYCNAFAAGLNDVVELAWLRMFDYRELQLLLSGTTEPIDLDDLQAHTVYGGKYNAGHPTVLIFWRVLSSFSERQKRLFLKFVTSCSRPPLLGFKDLWPKMSITYAGDSSRLPTASTCMNLLKLPEYTDETTLRDKLLYAIESGAGFELS